ncbi:MAG: inorganic pyrophosphatase [Nitrospira sp.]|nr:inorganic pyrophosphatase [Candidatus Manganitrophaceae bacterium]HIL34460.1 inorganic pyrophosphatase [Candidatus Manganitrophaceae bacterium]
MNVPPPFYRWRPHPWHGLEIGPDPPQVVHAYIEMTPFDLVKYEIDKKTGYLRVDRPQRSSSHPPSLYGFVPGTFCGKAVGALMEGSKKGDGDPLDICVFSERPITRSEVILNARVIGGLPMLDEGEADDKIIAVLANDNLWSEIKTIEEFPEILVERLRHYFTTYKLIPGEETRVSIGPAYGRGHAEIVIRAAIQDYEDEFGGNS